MKQINLIQLLEDIAFSLVRYNNNNMSRPAQIYDRIIQKNTKGIMELQSLLNKLSLQMLNEDQSGRHMDTICEKYDNVVEFFINKAKTYIPYEQHRIAVIQSLQSIGFSLAQSRQVNKYFNIITQTILSYFSDSSQKVKLAAIGAIYNLLTKYLEQGREFFIQIFQRLSVLIADQSGQIKQAATFLNQALKTIVYDAQCDQSGLNLKQFVQILAQRLQSGPTLAKQFMLDWLMAIQEVPQFQISFDLPLFFRQVFLLLQDPSKSLKSKAEQCLKKFLHVFKQRLALQAKISSKLSPESAQVIFQMIMILIRQNINAQINLHALEWLQIFTKFFTLELTKKSQPILEPIYSKLLKEVLLVVITMISDQSERIRKISARINESLLDAFPQMQLNKKSISRTSQLLEGLLAQSRAGVKVQAIFRWIKLFLKNNSQFFLSEINRLMSLVIEKLCDKNASRTLYQLIEGSLFVEKYYVELVNTLLNYLQKNDKIYPEPIFRQLMSLKDAQNHYLSLCKSIKKNKNQLFRYRLIQSLIGVLVAEHSLQILRTKLISKMNSDLFTQLFLIFSTNEAAAMLLCFLAGKYFLAKQFIQLLAQQQRLSDKNFRSLIRMSNLIEHSNMNHLRSDLRKSSTAMKAYLSLLMALPYSKCSGLLLQRVPPQMPFLRQQQSSEYQRQISHHLLKQYKFSQQKEVV